MKYALIGCGRIAINHLNAACRSGLEIVALCDTNIDRINFLTEKAAFRSPAAKYKDYRQMLQEHSEIELVAIATDSGSHAEIALYCIDRGIHVIIEKPMALSVKDADEIIARSRAQNVKVTVCHQNRFNIAAAKAKDALLAGKLGRLSHGSIHVRWNRSEAYYRQADWRGRWDSDGGCLFNQCIHGIDLLCWLINDEVYEVYGVTRRQFHNYIEAEDLGLAVLKFKSGAIATIEGTVNVYRKNLEETLFLFGENGTIKLGGTSANSIDLWDLKDETDDFDPSGFKEETANIYGNGHISLYDDMIAAIRRDTAPLITAEDAKKAIEIILAIYKSSKEGRAISLPLANGSSSDYKGMFD